MNAKRKPKTLEGSVYELVEVFKFDEFLKSLPIVVEKNAAVIIDEDCPKAVICDKNALALQLTEFLSPCGDGFMLTTEILGSGRSFQTRLNVISDGTETVISMYRGDVLPQIEGVDAAAGAKRFINKYDRYLSALIRLVPELEKQEVDSSGWLLPENAAQTRTRAHTIKGVAANLSVNSVYEVSAIFEKAVLDGNATEEMVTDYKKSCLDAKNAILAAFS